jgi:hypothetical protein
MEAQKSLSHASQLTLKRWGFNVEIGGAHTARTMMLEELNLLFRYVKSTDAGRDDYTRAIVEDNCLGKRTASTRKLTKIHLVELYGLDPSIAISRALRYFWQRDEKGRALIALLCAYARDPVLRISAPLILGLNEGELMTSQDMEVYLEQRQPGRFSKATLKSTAQNIDSTWTQSGHLAGKIKKYRSRAKASPGAVAYALLLAYLNGFRGMLLFENVYANILDCSKERALELAEQAARQGWLVFKRIAEVIEVAFPKVIKSPVNGADL